ncbi:hypothetical protein HanRHA438_Chr07g0311561 [Helianthus annuus]|uniref:Uncharacterized protein n=1 Tax=Helianthus annuus TaxID=4232 RepID=A0A9K3IMJ0_HELAN|nr:hypothetical protein HanXRQr2_Chr07g0301641 [Helianthus annuus]KAJ0563617.1 hypothetical protein HanHA89_Chr07g0265131 [Helianthus annuus]KAJ0728952.1 hypothetical protein HanLR1_Chr07g0247471 [Helianthus annuus]KAJ0731709.1 hypothetical protein HanOQP8_Chr07g0255031 [Helianthus annuus]KAJ0908541.1 hypothetical protein HanRHA438_Chr07g0311561 [Helianthus annuus]
MAASLHHYICLILLLTGNSIVSVNSFHLVSNGSITTLEPHNGIVTSNRITGSVWWQPLPTPTATKRHTIPQILPIVVAIPTHVVSHVLKELA